jgi:hypothetical protein
VSRALAAHPAVRVTGRDPHVGVHLAAWARSAGHRVEDDVVVRGPYDDRRMAGAGRAGAPMGVVAHPPATWGLAARGALVEVGGPALHSADLDERDEVWTDLAPSLYAQAAAGQWDPATAVDWSAPVRLPDEVEGAVVQVMTYLVENEQAALMLPARFLARVHPHFREVVQFLATQIADGESQGEHTRRHQNRRAGRAEGHGRGGRERRRTTGKAERDRMHRRPPGGPTPAKGRSRRSGRRGGHPEQVSQALEVVPVLGAEIAG